MRVLAIDFGSKRIGTAVCDELGLTVRPVETIKRSGASRDVERIKSLVRELEVEAVVIGLPLRLDGTSGDAAIAATRFSELLKRDLTVPVYMQDERLSSYEAEQIMAEQRLDRAQRRRRSDELAAMIILRDFLSTSLSQN
jgi:putative Holliday junction resolvase